MRRHDRDGGWLEGVGGLCIEREMNKYSYNFQHYIFIRKHILAS